MKAMRPSDCGWLVNQNPKPRKREYVCPACGGVSIRGRFCDKHRHRVSAHGHACLTNRRGPDGKYHLVYEPPTVKGAALREFWKRYPLPEGVSK